MGYKKKIGGYNLSDNNKILAQDDKSPCLMILKLNKHGEIIIDLLIKKKDINHTYTLDEATKLLDDFMDNSDSLTDTDMEGTIKSIVNSKGNTLCSRFLKKVLSELEIKEDGIFKKPNDLTVVKLIAIDNNKGRLVKFYNDLGFTGEYHENRYSDSDSDSESSGGKRKIPKKYTRGLSRRDRNRQVRNIRTARKNYKKKKYINRPKLKSHKKRESGWTAKFHKRHPNAKTVPEIAKATGIPSKALNAVKRKGMGAYYSSGSRPNQTAQSWGKARMYSYILGGPARRVDREITKRYNVKF